MNYPKSQQISKFLDRQAGLPDKTSERSRLDYLVIGNGNLNKRDVSAHVDMTALLPDDVKSRLFKCADALPRGQLG